MSTQTKTPAKPRKPRKRPERHARISQAVNGCHALLLEVGTEQFGYYLEAFPADCGSAFLLTKFEHCREEGQPDSYHVLLHGPHGHSCECRGFLRWHHCKHIESLLALIAQGKLTVPSKAVPTEAAPEVEIDSF